MTDEEKIVRSISIGADTPDPTSLTAVARELWKLRHAVEAIHNDQQKLKVVLAKLIWGPLAGNPVNIDIPKDLGVEAKDFAQSGLSLVGPAAVNLAK